MSRKSVAVAVVVAAAAFAVWFFAFHRRSGKDAAPAAPVAAGSGAPLAPPAKTESDHAAPRGAAPRWSFDADPEGPLRLEGQVVDADGHGVGGAEVTLESVPARTAKTEGDGSFAFDKLVGREYTLEATRGDSIGSTTFKLTGASDPVVIRLGEGAAVDVTVNDERAQPVAGADVKVPGLAARTAKTDDHGKATVKGIHPGWVAVEATAPGYATAQTYTSIGTAGGKGTVQLVLRKGAAVSGRVVDEAGKPIAKVRVTASEPNGWARDRGEVTSDEQGRFAFAALAPGSHVLSASDGEHAPAKSTPITVVAEKPVGNVEIRMQAGAVIAGTVVDVDGKPRAFATVRVAGKGDDMWRTASRGATTDQRGAFEVRGLARAKLVARAESDVAASKLVDIDLTTQANARDLKLVLDVSGAIAGVVVDETGAPVTEVQVDAFPDVLAGASTDGLAIGGMSSATTDGAGRFTIRGLPDGGYRVWAARHSSSDMGFGKQSVAAKVGDTNVRIVMPAPGGLRGTLVIAGGAAPKLAYVQLGMQPSTPSSSTGAFELKELAPGPYDLHVWGPEFTEFVQHDVKIEPGKVTDLGTLTVVHGRRLAGKVVDGSGQPVAGARIKLGEMLFSAAGSDDDQAQNWEDASGIRSSTTDQDGAFVVTGVPPKPTTVMADHPDRGRSAPAPVPDGADDPPAITLTLRGYGSIVGTVTQKGKPLASVTVSESTKGGGAQAAFAETGADGTFTMPKVAEGTHVLNALQTGMMSMKSSSATVQVVAGKQTTVAIDIPVGTITLSVNVQAMPNNKVDAAQVFLLQGAVAITNAKQLVDGFFQGGLQGMKFWFGAGKPLPEFDELVPGNYSVCAVPITGDLSDPTFQQRLQENMQALRVYCKQVTVAASPQQQTVVDPLPAMTPLS